MSDDEGEFMLVVGHGSGGRAKVKRTGVTTAEGMYDKRREDVHAFAVPAPRKERMAVAEAAAHVRRLKAELRSHGVGQAALQGLRRAVADLPREADARPELRVACLGLGTLVASSASRYQAAMLLLAVDDLKEKRCKASVCGTPTVYDPIFTDEDKEVCSRLGLDAISDNTEGKDAIASPTLMFMPHCSRSLYANLLRENWSPDALSQLVVFGNTFADYTLRAVSKADKQSVDAMQRLEPATQSLALPRFKPCGTAFSDTSVMWFPKGGLATLGPDVWGKRPPEPSKDHDLATRDATQSS